MRKPAFCICKNKDADQLRGNREADQRLCFALQIVQSIFFLDLKFQASNHILSQYSLDGNLEDRFSHNEAQFVIRIYKKQVFLRQGSNMSQLSHAKL